MSISDIINPWGALRRERRAFALAVADYEGERALGKDALRASQQRAEAVREHLDRETARGILLAADNRRLKKIIAKGHFRNPETGRIGPIGEVYE